MYTGIEQLSKSIANKGDQLSHWSGRLHIKKEIKIINVVIELETSV